MYPKEVQMVISRVLDPMFDALKGSDGALYVNKSDVENIRAAVAGALEERWPRKYMVRIEFDSARMSVVLQESGQTSRRAQA